MNNLQFYKEIKIQKGFEKGIFMLRHAEKSPIIDGMDGINVPLTEHGNKKAIELGNILHDLSYNVCLIKSSPFKRCIETSEGILRGMDFIFDIEYSDKLGDPGPFVVDDKIAGNNFTNYSALDVVSRQLRGEISPGMRSTKEGVKILLNEIQKDLEIINGFGIYVTHDVIIAPFVGYLNKIPITKENWFGFLDGIFLYLENGNISMKRILTAPSRGRGPFSNSKGI